jgi:hypothetical protein
MRVSVSNFAVEWFGILLRILGIPGLIFVPKVLNVYPQHLQTNAGKVPCKISHNRLILHHFKLIIHIHLPILCCVSQEAKKKIQ